jgi:hypothetical protein
LNLYRDVSSALYHKLNDNKYISDPFSQFTELNDYDIYAGDGHYHSAASHDIRKGGKKYSTLHFYSVNLRTNGLNHLTLADTSGARKKEHDMRALKRLDRTGDRQIINNIRDICFLCIVCLSPDFLILLYLLQINPKHFSFFEYQPD